MSNNPEIEPARFYVESPDNWQYWIYDREHERRAPQGPFQTSAEAIEHAKELNSIRWR